MAKISPERRALYYTGLGLMVLGFITFFSVFISGASDFGTLGPGGFSGFEQRTRSMATRGVLGMGLMIVGGVVTSIGAKGAAGSGLKLDPEQAREDLKPWTEMAGGMVSDALNQVDAFKPASQVEAATEVKVRCQQCRTLNDEDARFCKGCGASL